MNKQGATEKLFTFPEQKTNSPAPVTPLAPSAEQMQRIFEEVERELPFRDGEVFDGMLSFTENLKKPLHRWYNYKEGYSHRLVAKVLKRYPTPAKYPSVLDPFCGAGTTLLVAQFDKRSAVGVELNPFAAFLSKVKTSWHKIDPEKLEIVLNKVLDDTTPAPSSLPALSTFRKNRYFPNGNAYELFRLRDVIEKRRTTPEVKNALLLALAASIEDVSHLHKDGRLLRYRLNNVISPKEALEQHARIIIEDVESMAKKHCYKNISFIEGDARQLDCILVDSTLPKKFGLILYSPPYMNSFDYSEVYKCELWLLGMIRSYEQWRQLRLSTFRSHPSCKFPVTHHLRDNPDLHNVWSLVEQAARCPDIGGSAQKKAPNIIRGYFDDVFKMLQQQLTILGSGGHIVCVVGNSRHGKLHIPTDALIAKIGQALGLELVEIYVGKHRNSRNYISQKLRESLVVFKKI